MATRSSAKTGQTARQNASIAMLRTRQRKLIKHLRTLNPQVSRGSLITRYTRCGKPRCRCVAGGGHGPKSYLSVSRAGRRPHLLYVPQAMVAQVQQQVAQLQTFRPLLEELCEIACALLTRRAGR
jgi:hypothetical protein